MKLKRIMATMLSLCIVVGSLAGCSDKENKKSKNNTEINGKYMEEAVEIPLQQNETILCLVKNSQGNPEVYTQGENGACLKYTTEDGKEWAGDEASWLSQISGGSVLDIAAGLEGNTYALVVDEESKMHVLKQTGEDAAEEIGIPELNEAGNDYGTDFYSFGTRLLVMEDGSLVLEGDSAVKIYAGSGGELLHSFSYTKSSTDGTNPVAVKGKKLVLPNKENNGFSVWNVEKEEEEALASYGSDVRSGKVILEDNNEIYFLNTDGIHHMNAGGTLVETLADGSSLTMGTPTAYIKDFVKGATEDFYVLYTGNQTMIKHYYYDKTAKTSTDKKLSIYSLKENDTIRQAISAFQQKYPEVEVAYKTGESDTSTTTADKIRVLNTELLNKSGADILVLDNLPVDSFMEKGVLKNISDVIEPLIKDGTLQKNISECYQQENGKIYSMPIKYGVPLLFGNQEKIDAMENLDTLEKWLNAHPEEKLIEAASYEELTRLFVNMYYEELFDENGKLKEDKLKQCISSVKETGQRYDAEIEKHYVDDNGQSLEEGAEDFTLSEWLAGTGIGEEVHQVTSQEIKSTFDMMVPSAVMRENNFPIRFNHNTFVPHGMVGINDATENTKWAEEFIKILFSDEVQKYDLNDGFPMNQNVAVQWREQGLDSLDDEKGMSASVVQVGGDDEGNTYNYTMPLKSEIETLIQKTVELTKPAEADSVLQDMIMEEAKGYYEGSQKLEQVVAGIIAKVDTYRAE